MDAELHCQIPGVTTPNQTRLWLKLDSIYFLNGKCLACLFLKLTFALSWFEIRHKRRHCQWENSFTHIRFIYKEKLKKKSSEIIGQKNE